MVIAAAATAGAQSFSAGVTARNKAMRKQALNPTSTRAVGAFPRVSRNPIQLLNPLAPRRYYGPPEETVTWEPYFNRDRFSGSPITGLILFGLRW